MGWNYDLVPLSLIMTTSRIGIESIKIFAYHGYYDIEQKIGQEFVLDIYVAMDLIAAGASDQLPDSINYEDILVICKEEMMLTSRILEHVATRIGHRIQILTAQRIQVTVRISKHHPGLPLPIDRFFVEIVV